MHSIIQCTPTPIVHGIPSFSLVVQSSMSELNANQLRESLKGLTIDLLEETEEVLGKGSYGDVFLVRLSGLRCAAKKLEASLFDESADENRESIERRFSEQCIKASQLRHPNIVQLLGVYFGESIIPKVVMELLTFTLPSVLETYLIPTYTKDSILLDVAMGLRHMHEQTPPVVHGHFSARSVLLTSSLQAKITCSLGIGTVQNKYLSYAPPESRRDEPPGVKGDVFSFGNLIIHVSLQKELLLPDDLSLSEIQRREKLLEELDTTLQGLVKLCLHNDPSLRTSTTEVVTKLNSIVAANPPKYANILEILHALDHLSTAKEHIVALNAVIEAKNEASQAQQSQQDSLRDDIEAKSKQLESKEEEIEVQMQALHNKDRVVHSQGQTVRAKDALIKAKDMEIAAKNREIAAKNSQIRSSNRRIELLEQQLISKRQLGSMVRSPSISEVEPHLHSPKPAIHVEPPQVATKPVRGEPTPKPAEAEDIVIRRKLKGRRSNTMIASDGYRYQNWNVQKSKSVDVAEQLDPKLAAWIAKRQQQEQSEEASAQDLGSINERKEEDSGVVTNGVVLRRQSSGGEATPELQKLLTKRRSDIEFTADDIN